MKNLAYILWEINESLQKDLWDYVSVATSFFLAIFTAWTLWYLRQNIRLTNKLIKESRNQRMDAQLPLFKCSQVRLKERLNGDSVEITFHLELLGFKHFNLISFYLNNEPESNFVYNSLETGIRLGTDYSITLSRPNIENETNKFVLNYEDIHGRKLRTTIFFNGTATGANSHSSGLIEKTLGEPHSKFEFVEKN